MKRSIYLALTVGTLLSCEHAEVASISAITANWEAYRGRSVQLEGLRVSRDSNVIASSSRLLDYVTIEDESGRVDVWYDVARRRCPPRLGATVTADGEVTDISATDAQTGDTATRQVFVAGSFSIVDEPPLEDGEVRLCQLSLEDQQMYAEEGSEGLVDYWLASGKRARTVVLD